MGKKQMLTVLYLIPTSNGACDAFDVVDIIARQLGYLNCKTQDDVAAIKYDDILSQDVKEKLTDIADDNNFVIKYVETEYETPFVNCDTIHIPTADEMQTHLNWIKATH